MTSLNINLYVAISSDTSSIIPEVYLLNLTNGYCLFTNFVLISALKWYIAILQLWLFQGKICLVFNICCWNILPWVWCYSCSWNSKLVDRQGSHQIESWTFILTGPQKYLSIFISLIFSFDVILFLLIYSYIIY